MEVEAEEKADRRRRGRSVIIAGRWWPVVSGRPGDIGGRRSGRRHPVDVGAARELVELVGAPGD